MQPLSLDQVIFRLKKDKALYQDRYGVTRIGVFGSFIREEQTGSSDLDIVIEMESEKKTLHNFLELKRNLEKSFGTTVDLGFEHTLKPILKKELLGKIIYV